MVFWRKRREQDLDRELRDHLELEAAEQDRRALGNTARIKEDVREAWGWTWLDRLAQDVRYTARVLRRSPGFTAVAVGPALHLIARLYAVEDRAKTLALSAEQRRALRQRVSARLMEKLHHYLLELQPEVLPKSPSGAAVRYALNQWEALARFLEDGVTARAGAEAPVDLEIDNGAAERANRDIALGRGNWTFFGSDNGGKTAAVLRNFVASCKRCGVEPFTWFRDVLSRIPSHPITQLRELLPQGRKHPEFEGVGFRRSLPLAAQV